MKGMSGMLAEAYSSCLTSVSQCCAPLTGTRDDTSRRGFSEKQAAFRVLHEQPTSTPAPRYGGHNAQYSNQGLAPWESDEKPWASSKGKKRQDTFDSGSRTRFSVRRRFRSASSPDPRRPQISVPYDFRHLHTESFQFPQYTQMRTIPRPGPRQFRPIELSIYEPQNRLSPLLPHFDFPGIPPLAKLAPTRVDDFTLANERSGSSMSFHIPRRPTGGSPSTAYSDSPPRIPPKSRARAYTSPNIESIKERIARGMNEMEELQNEIDSVIERQSIYAPSSRPSTAHSMGPFDLEPMPSIPALPPAAPSFSQRLAPGADRPRTAPSRHPHTPQRAMAVVDAAAAAFITPPPSRESDERPLAPPLPLVLRPPLRKKKSFSRVSSWLFPGNAEHSRDLSLDSVTNLPRPVTGREGFYQCVAPSGSGNGAPSRRSFDSDMTVTTWRTEDEQTAPTTTWSPGSTPATKAEQVTPLERTTTFGRESKNSSRPRGPSVGVAF